MSHPDVTNAATEALNNLLMRDGLRQPAARLGPPSPELYLVALDGDSFRDGLSVTYQQHPASTEVALAYPAARHALARMRRAWGRFTRISGIVALSCLVAVPLSIAVGVVLGGGAARAIIGGLGSLAFLGTVIGGSLAFVGFQTLRKTDRMEWVMSHNPWVERHRYHIEGGRHVVVSIAADQNGPEARCFAAGGFGRASLDRLNAGVGYQPLLIAGDPRQLAVITTPAMQDLYLVRPGSFWM